MAIRVGTGNVTTKQVAVAGSNTQVKKVVVGTPVRRVSSGGFTVNNIGGISTEGAVDGSMLIYNGETNRWEATIELEEQNINGGSY